MLSIPSWVRASPLYDRLFNQVAGEMGLPLSVKPATGPDTLHLLQAGADRIELTPAVASHYGIAVESARVDHPLITRDVGLVVEEIERRRQVMIQGAMGVYPILPSGTYTHNKMSGLNPAEQEWVRRVREPLYEASQSLYGHQAMPEAESTLAWIRSSADSVSRFHFERSRGSAFAVSQGAEFPDAKLYANALPWLPESPSYNNMWPIDLSEAELSFINERYPADDPIRLPYTRVFRISSDEAQRIESSPRTHGDRQIEWARQGLDGRWYRVVNMAFDESMRPHFLKMVDALRKDADIEVEGSRLHPAFRDYLLTVADCLESGDFNRLLQADIDQSDGALYLTLFPHEGYWDDGIKYPLIFGYGILDEELLASAQGHGYVVNWLGALVERVAREEGLTGYQAPVFDERNLRRDAVFYWPIRTGGFMRAFPRDPGGHDYPKRDYSGVTGHKNVILQDVIETWAPLTQKVAEVIFGPAVAQHVSFWGMSHGSFLHEAGHGAQIRQNVVVLNGQPFSQALKDRWGVLVEPWADAGSILAHYQLRRDGHITEDEFRQAVYSNLIYSIVRLFPRQIAASDGVAKEGPHIAGSSMFLGWLYREGVLTRGSEFTLELHEERIEEATQKFFDQLTRFAVRGDYEAFLAFVTETMEMLPEDLERELLAKKKSVPAYTILNRGCLVLPQVA